MAEPQEGTNQAPAANLPLNPDLMGYPTVEALVNAKRASDQEVAKIIAERDEYRNRLLQNTWQPENPRQNVPQRNTLEDRLEAAGIPIPEVRELARAVVREEFEPISKGLTARNTVLAHYPDYGKFEADVAQFIQSDPELSQTYQRMFTADPVGAFEYAFLKFGDQRRRSQPGDASGLMAEAGAHAGIPSSRNGDARRSGVNQNELQKARDEYERTRSADAALRYAHARLGGAISDDFLNQ